MIICSDWPTTLEFSITFGYNDDSRDERQRMTERERERERERESVCVCVRIECSNNNSESNRIIVKSNDEVCGVSHRDIFTLYLCKEE